MKKVALLLMLMVTSVSMAQLEINRFTPEKIAQINFQPKDTVVKLKFKSNNYSAHFAGSRKMHGYTEMEFLKNEGEIEEFVEVLKMLDTVDVKHYLKMTFSNDAQIVKLRNRALVTLELGKDYIVIHPSQRQSIIDYLSREYQLN